MGKYGIQTIALTGFVALGAATTPVSCARAADAAPLEPEARIRATVVETIAEGKTRSRGIDGTFVALDDSTLTIQPNGAQWDVETGVPETS